MATGEEEEKKKGMLSKPSRTRSEDKNLPNIK
jgi:hypothetical protein